MGDDLDACFQQGFAAMPADHQEFILGAAEAAAERGARGHEIVRAGAARRAAYLEEIERRQAGLSAPEALPEQTAPSQPCPADEEARAAAPECESPASPGTGPAEPASSVAGSSRPAAWRWTGPLNPPQATCDEAGRLIMPDPADVAEYNERLRRGLTFSEIVDRSRV